MLFTHALMEAHFNNHNFDENYKEIDVYSDILEHVSLLMIWSVKCEWWSEKIEFFSYKW